MTKSVVLPEVFVILIRIFCSCGDVGGFFIYDVMMVVFRVRCLKTIENNLVLLISAVLISSLLSDTLSTQITGGSLCMSHG